MGQAAELARTLETSTGVQMRDLKIGFVDLSEDALAEALVGRKIVDSHADDRGLLLVLDDGRVFSVSQRVTYEDSWIEYSEVQLP